MSKKRNRIGAADYVYDTFRNDNRNNPSMARTAIIEQMYIRVLFDLCMNRFKWTGAEDTGISVRFMELTLLKFGLAVVFKEDSIDKVIAVQGAPSGQWNWIQDPIAYTVYGNLMRSKMISTRDCVPVWSNYMRRPDTDIIYIYAKRLAEIDRTIEINMASARRNKVAFVTENQRLSMVNINRQLDQGESFVQLNIDTFQDGTLDSALKAVDLGVDPDSIEKLHILRTRLWGECMGFLGFDFANQDKKERLVASEVDANNSQVDGMRFVNLNARRDACQLINKKYDLNLGVEYHITSETSDAAIPAAPELTGGTYSPGATPSGE